MMSFKIGKPHMVLALMGGVILLIQVSRKWRKATNFKIPLFVAVLTICSFLLTLEASRFVWVLFEPIMSLFQFPWRFLVFAMLGCAFFSAYLFNVFKPHVKFVPILAVVIVLFLTGQKYFIKPLMGHAEYDNQFNSLEYRNRYIAFMMREYLPKDVTYSYWHYLNPLEVKHREMEFDYTLPVDFRKDFAIEKDTPFSKRVIANDEGVLYANVHNFPKWNVYQNGVKLNPNKFDHLARPELQVQKGDVIVIQYKQTPIQKTSNMLTVVGFIGLLYLVKKQKRLLARL